MQRFYRLARFFAENVWDTTLELLVAREDFRRRFDLDAVQREAWRSLAEEPLGRAIERHLQNDLLRGLVFTDAKIGVFTHPHDETLLQNRCFLYHLIGNKRGEWKVPVGGWALSHASWNKPRARAAPRCLTRVDLQALALRNKMPTLKFEQSGKTQSAEA